MNKNLHKRVNATIAILLIVLVYGCSDNGQESTSSEAPKVQKEIKHVPVVVLPQQSYPAQAEKKREEKERPLKIGVIGPETGLESHYGLSVVEGVMAAAKFYNAHGGADGKEIEVLHFDNKDDLGLTREGVKHLINQRVIAILSAPTGWSTFAPTRMVNRSHTLFIAVGTRRRIGRSGPYVFRASLPDELATTELISYTTNELGYKNYALVTASQYDYSLDLSSLFKQAVLKFNGSIKIDADTYDTYTGQQNLEKVIDAIKSSPDTLHAVIFTGGVEDAVVLAKELKESKLSLPIIGGEDLFTAEYLRGGEGVRGSLLYATFAPDRKSPKTTEFLQGYKKGTPDRFAALAYDSFMLVAAAIREAGTTKPTKVREALVGIKGFEGATGTISFSPEGSIVKHPFIYRVEGGDKGEKFVLLKHQYPAAPSLSNQ